METKPPSFFIRIKDNLSLFSLILLMLSLYRLVLFYHYFGIDIFTYIDFTEALLLTTPFFIVIGIVMIVLSITTVVRVKTAKQLAPYPDAPQDANFKQRFRHYTSPFGYYTFFFGYPLLFAFAIYVSWEMKWYDSLEYTSTGVLIVLLNLFREFWANELGSILKGAGIAISKVGVQLILFAFVILLLLTAQTRYHAFYIVNGETNELDSVKFAVDNDIFITNDTIRYIGKTKEWIFLYNNKSGVASAYSTGDAKGFSIQDSNPHKVRLYEVKKSEKDVTKKAAPRKHVTIKPFLTLDTATTTNH